MSQVYCVTKIHAVVKIKPLIVFYCMYVVPLNGSRSAAQTLAARRQLGITDMASSA
jgi:hypothetical protein